MPSISWPFALWPPGFGIVGSSVLLRCSTERIVFAARMRRLVPSPSRRTGLRFFAPPAYSSSARPVRCWSDSHQLERAACALQLRRVQRFLVSSVVGHTIALGAKVDAEAHAGRDAGGERQEQRRQHQIGLQNFKLGWRRGGHYLLSSRSPRRAPCKSHRVVSSPRSSARSAGTRCCRSRWLGSQRIQWRVHSLMHTRLRRTRAVVGRGISGCGRPLQTAFAASHGRRRRIHRQCARRKPTAARCGSVLLRACAAATHVNVARSEARSREALSRAARSPHHRKVEQNTRWQRAILHSSPQARPRPLYGHKAIARREPSSSDGGSHQVRRQPAVWSCSRWLQHVLGRRNRAVEPTPSATSATMVCDTQGVWQRRASEREGGKRLAVVCTDGDIGSDGFRRQGLRGSRDVAPPSNRATYSIAVHPQIANSTTSRLKSACSSSSPTNVNSALETHGTPTSAPPAIIRASLTGILIGLSSVRTFVLGIMLLPQQRRRRVDLNRRVRRETNNTPCASSILIVAPHDVLGGPAFGAKTRSATAPRAAH